MSRNAWPSSQDGIIRRLDPEIFFIFIHTEPTALEQFGNSTLTWREKIPYCESVYKRLGTPAVFKISPLVSPDFDYVLENRGYAIQHTTNVMAMSMNAAHLDTPYPDVTFYNNIPSEWIESLFNLKNTIKSDSQKSCTIHVSGNSQRNHLRLYPHRRADHCNRAWYPGQRLHRYLRHPCQRGIPQTWLCPSDLHRTSERRNEKGAQNAYLQVVEGNDNARALYRSLGFQQLYTYWFRVQPDENGNFPPEK